MALSSVGSDIHMVCLCAVSNSIPFILRFCSRKGCFTFLCKWIPLGFICPPVEDLTVCVIVEMALANARVAKEGLLVVAPLVRYLLAVRVVCLTCCFFAGVALKA